MSDIFSVSRYNPVKNLTRALRSSGGRNVTGRITSFHRGGGVKRRYRVVDFSRQFREVPAVVRRFEYDPARKAYLALICYQNGVLSYILSPVGLKEGSFIISTISDSVPLSVGDSSMLKNMPRGVPICCISVSSQKPATFVRAAATSAMILRHGSDFCLVKLPSGEHRLFSSDTFAVLGEVSGIEKSRRNLGSAGTSRLLGRRPTVRGVAMNPVDHPHGGGEGKSSGGRHPVTPWGKLTRGFRTVRNRPSLVIKPRFKLL